MIENNLENERVCENTGSEPKKKINRWTIVQKKLANF